MTILAGLRKKAHTIALQCMGRRGVVHKGSAPLFEDALRSLKELAVDLRGESRVENYDRRIGIFNQQGGAQLPKLLDAIDQVVADVDPVNEDWEARQRAGLELAEVCDFLETQIRGEIEQNIRKYVQPLRDLLEE